MFSAVALLDEDETAVLRGASGAQENSLPRQRIDKIGDPGGQAYVMVSGRVRRSRTWWMKTSKNVVDDAPVRGVFRFASMLSRPLRNQRDGEVRITHRGSQPGRLGTR